MAKHRRLPYQRRIPVLVQALAQRAETPARIATSHVKDEDKSQGVGVHYLTFWRKVKAVLEEQGR